MPDRRLTVSTLYEPRVPRSEYDPYPERVVPYLRMRGQWLERLGFCPGSRVRVQGKKGRLVLTLDRSTDVPAEEG